MQIEFEVDLKPIQRKAKPASMTLRAADRLPKITKLLVLAYQIEQAIDDGRAKDYADVACQLGVTRARITQVMNLLSLSPDIQATILTEPHRVRHVTERRLRALTEALEWHKQNKMFGQLLGQARGKSLLD